MTTQINTWFLTNLKELARCWRFSICIWVHKFKFRVLGLKKISWKSLMVSLHKFKYSEVYCQKYNPALFKVLFSLTPPPRWRIDFCNFTFFFFHLSSLSFNILSSRFRFPVLRRMSKMLYIQQWRRPCSEECLPSVLSFIEI